MGERDVVMAILARDAEPFLPLYLTSLYRQSFPKKRIRLYIRTNDNSDDTVSKLESFVASTESEYASVLFDSSSAAAPPNGCEWSSSRCSTLARLRQASLFYALEKKADYFTADVDNFLQPHVLEDVLAAAKEKEGVVAPLLVSSAPGDAYSNFFAASDANGFFAKSDRYAEILERRDPGVHTVDTAHCTYAIPFSVLEKRPTYIRTDPTAAWYEFITFSSSLKSLGVSQFIDSRKPNGWLFHVSNASKRAEAIAQLVDSKLEPNEAWQTLFAATRDPPQEGMLPISVNNAFSSTPPCFNLWVSSDSTVAPILRSGVLWEQTLVAIARHISNQVKIALDRALSLYDFGTGSVGTFSVGMMAEPTPIETVSVISSDETLAKNLSANRGKTAVEMFETPADLSYEVDVLRIENEDFNSVSRFLSSAPIVFFKRVSEETQIASSCLALYHRFGDGANGALKIDANNYALFPKYPISENIFGNWVDSFGQLYEIKLVSGRDSIAYSENSTDVVYFIGAPLDSVYSVYVGKTFGTIKSFYHGSFESDRMIKWGNGTRWTNVSIKHPTPPVVVKAIGTEAEVCKDIAARQQLGIAKYGATVGDNPLPLKEWLQHAYEEALDQAIYLKRAISLVE